MGIDFIIFFSACCYPRSKLHGVPKCPSKLKPFPCWILLVYIQPTATILQHTERLYTIILLLSVGVSQPTLGKYVAGKISKIIGIGKVKSGEKAELLRKEAGASVCGAGQTELTRKEEAETSMLGDL